MLTLLKLFLRSRKFWLALIAALVPVLNVKLGLGLTEEQVIAAVMPLIALIFGIAYEDSKKTAPPSAN